MSMIRRSRTVFSTFAAVLTFALVAPIAVNADDGVIAAVEQVLAAEPVAPSWDELSGYVSVERTRADVSALWSSAVIPDQEHALAYAAAAAAALWDVTSGYGSVEATRAANALAAAPAAFTSQVPADVRWAPAGTIGQESSIGASLAVSLDYLPVALGTGRRSESAHLATIALAVDAVSVNPSDDRIAAALFDDEPRG